MSKKKAPQRSQQDSRLLGFCIAVILSLFGVLLTLVFQAYLPTKTENDNNKVALEAERERGRKLSADLNSALKQNNIFKYLGPNVMTFQRLTVGRNGETSEIYLGRCPNVPCYKIQYEGLSMVEGVSALKWSVDGTSSGTRRLELRNTAFNFPARERCYGKITAPNDEEIRLLLENIPSPDTFDVVVALVNSPSSSGPAKEGMFSFPFASADCFPE